MALFTLFLRRMLFSKKTIFFAVLSLAFSLTALIQRDSGLASSDFYQQYVAPIFLSGLGAFIPMYFGTRAFSEEIESKTILYLLTRPRARWEYVVQKYLAASAASMILLIPPAILAAVILPKSDPFVYSSVPVLCLTLALASLTYTSFFLFAGILLKRPIVFGLIVTFGWENFVSHVPGEFRNLTIINYLRAFLLRGYEISKMFGSTVQEDIPQIRTCALVLLCVIAVGVGLAFLAMEKKEFH